jgi:hypothetical protein
MRHQLLAGAAFGALLFGSFSSGAALAADIAPVYKARPVVVSDDYYVWADAMYERVNLPTYSLGLNRIGVAPAFPDLRAGVQTFDPRLNGAGVRGAFGYRLPGSGLRLEAGGSLVAAGSNPALASVGGPFTGLQFLNGFMVTDAFNCDPAVFVCSVSGTLKTSYTAWQLNGRALYDWRFANVTVTPSVAVFGGTARADQTLSQAFTQSQIGVGVVNAGNYAAYTSLRWTDVGARAGLDVNAAVTDTLPLGIGGWVGIAGRHTSLSGNDVGGGDPIFAGASTIGVSDSTGVFLANVEASAGWKVSPTTTLRGFVGANYDDKVPGIARPFFSGAVNNPTGATPASIFYAHETSYYAGAGVTVKLGGGPVIAKY